MFWYECEICGTELDPDYSCPLCIAQEAAEEFFVCHEKNVLGWMTAEEYDLTQYGRFDEEEIEQGLQNSFYSEEDFQADADFLERLSWMDDDWECTCPVCTGAPNLDPAFILIENAQADEFGCYDF